MLRLKNGAIFFIDNIIIYVTSHRPMIVHLQRRAKYNNNDNMSYSVGCIINIWIGEFHASSA
jgi:hypothetical protein